MINNKHQNRQSVFSRQSHSESEQILSTSGLVPAAGRTKGHHPARQTRAIPLNAKGVSRDSARPAADWKGEGPHHPTHTDHRPAINFQTRPEAVPTHTRKAEPNPHRDTHQRQVVTLMQLTPTRNIELRTDIPRPDTVNNSQASRSPGRGEHVDPDNSLKCVTHGQRPRGGVRQDKGFLAKALSASQEPAPLEKGAMAHIVNKDSPRSQDALRPHSLSNARVKLVHTTVWLHPLVRAELERIAECERLTLSQVGATSLDQWVRHRLHAQHEALLYPVLRQLIRDELAAFGNRLVFFLMRIAFAAEQTRILVTNILDRMLKKDGAEPKIFNSLVDQSSKMARRNIIAKTPQIKSLMEEWLGSRSEDKQETPRKEKTRD